MNLEGVDEVLLTPHSVMLPNEPKEILIDNGCFVINRRGGSLQNLDLHIERCKVLSKDHRCIFLLPDIESNPEAAIYYVNKFMQEVKPLRFAVVDLPIIMNEFPELVDHSEIFAIPSKRAKLASQDIFQYHLLGSNPQVLARSWDDLQFNSDLPIAQAVLNRQEEVRLKLGYWGGTAPTRV
jgi:hypothetical protein